MQRLTDEMLAKRPVDVPSLRAWIAETYLLNPQTDSWLIDRFLERDGCPIERFVERVKRPVHISLVTNRPAAVMTMPVKGGTITFQGEFEMYTDKGIVKNKYVWATSSHTGQRERFTDRGQAEWWLTLIDFRFEKNPHLI